MFIVGIKKNYPRSRCFISRHQIYSKKQNEYLKKKGSMANKFIFMLWDGKEKSRWLSDMMANCIYGSCTISMLVSRWYRNFCYIFANIFNWILVFGLSLCYRSGNLVEGNPSAVSGDETVWSRKWTFTVCSTYLSGDLLFCNMACIYWT